MGDFPHIPHFWQIVYKICCFFIILCVYPWAKPVRAALAKFARLVGTDPAKGFSFMSSTSAAGAQAPLVHAFQQMGLDEIYTSYFVRYMDKSQMELHAVEDIGVETAVEMKEAIGRGDIVLMAGDRLSAGTGRTAVLRHAFLGRDCAFPKGVFRFAKLMECPVCAITCVRVGWNAYKVEAKRMGTDLLGDYVAFLESAARRHPDQWYQFYDFFA